MFPPPLIQAERSEVFVWKEMAAAGVDSFFELHSQALAYLWRPNHRLTSRAMRTRARVGWPASRPVLSLHIRRGDACRDDHLRPCPKVTHHIKP